MNEFPTTPVYLSSRRASGIIRTGIAASGNRVMINVFGTYAELDPDDAMWLAQQLESTAIALVEAEEMDQAARRVWPNKLDAGSISSQSIQLSGHTLPEEAARSISAEVASNAQRRATVL